MSQLTGLDLTAAPLEVNVFHFGAGAWMGPHVDLNDKIVTHVLYFNRAWEPAAGGCLRILCSADENDVAAEVSPVVGNSAVIVRSDKSWHAVSRIARDRPVSRRSVNVTFYQPGSKTTMWQPGIGSELHDYHGGHERPARRRWAIAQLLSRIGLGNDLSKA